MTDAGTDFFVVLVVVGLLLLGAFIFAPLSCGSRWEGSGYETRWGPFKGCQVNVEGKWLPEKAIRSTEER